ncbi:MAG: hypothetical protein ACRBF0_00185 [Calditrichia bacterium]
MSSIVAATRQTIESLINTHGKGQKSRIDRGVRQVAARWSDDDGDNQTFDEFCQQHFISDSEKLTRLRDRFQSHLESIYGNFHRTYRELNWALHVDTGEMQPVDSLFANFDVFAHIQEDLFKARLAFVALLNFPLYTLEEKNRDGLTWERHVWADARLADRFDERIPGHVKQHRTSIYAAAEDYVYSYNIYMHNLLNKSGKRVFPKEMKLISHWGLRDEIKAQYAEPDGLEKQKLIEKVMQRIISQEIPQGAINNPNADWQPDSNKLSPHQGHTADDSPEKNRRYSCLWSTFEAERQLDAFTPSAPSLIDRRFKQNREISEKNVEALLHSVLDAPVLSRIADLIRKRMGRKLEPFDIWYSGFAASGSTSELELDAQVQKAFSDTKSFEKGLSDILHGLGFSKRKSTYLQRYIKVDAARGAGHALGAQMRKDTAHLRTRVPSSGMDYKGFNTAMHELGHSVEQVFSMNDIDYYTLEGVPNTAFTEAFAFVFQGRDLQVLGLSKDDVLSEASETLHTVWQTLEIAGVSLLDMRIWRWMYENPEAGPEALKEAVLMLSADIWNTYFTPLFGSKNQHILAIYSHILYCGMYIPDYAIGHIIAFQIESYLKKRNLAREMERMCKLGCLAPQVWMQKALGEQISAAAMLEKAEDALTLIQED